MKYLIPAAAVLALAICGLYRREAPDHRPDPVAVARTPEASEVPEVSEVGRASTPVAETAPIPAPVAPGPTLESLQPAALELFQILRGRLELTEAQEVQVAEALKLRAKELRECQEAWRKMGIFIPREYGSQLARMKETWYRRIDGVLDSDQHRTFDRMVIDGFFRPGTDFSVDLMTMSVLR